MNPNNPNSGEPNQDHAAQQTSTTPPAAQIVYVTRPLEPTQPHLSPALLKQHETSKQQYPELQLSGGEYVISDVRRHPIGLLTIWGVVILVGLLLLIILPAYAAHQADIGKVAGLRAEQVPSTLLVSIPLLIILALLALGGTIATIVYRDNRFFLTNESVIQHIRVSLFSRKEQTISLSNIEDASYLQHGILPSLLNYGSLRLSTQGDETTYRFQYVSNPKAQLMKLNDAVEAFKNGRPVDPDER